jgi:hypothetical protein
VLAGAVVSGAGVAELALGAGSIVSVGGLATGDIFVVFYGRHVASTGTKNKIKI